MDSTIPPKKTQYQHSPPRNSPLRNSSTASTNSSSYSTPSYPSTPSRTSTLTSSSSAVYQGQKIGHKRGLTEAGMSVGQSSNEGLEAHTHNAYKSIRQSLRPLAQPPISTAPAYKGESKTIDRGTEAVKLSRVQEHGPDACAMSAALIGHVRRDRNAQDSASLQHESRLLQANALQPDHSHFSHHSTFIAPDLAELRHSSTSQLRTLSKLTHDSPDETFSISSSGPSVVGLQGRRQLKKSGSVRAPGNGPEARGQAAGWGGHSWMDRQRQFLQAYEYLCHIGEAKEWIEDIIHKPIPPIVQLEEALRDGVTLAEIVQALGPERPVRIFRNPKLQFRHSDNIATFFRFLAEIELPELFRFELIDLYEKKNIPKVIYCIHALSWLLYRNGMVSFRIGNLVGQLQFEHHELEEMQKGLDKAGVSMPSFQGMGASFGAEPEPIIAESEEERMDRELAECKGDIVDLQAQARGCIIRMRLGQTMQQLWDSEELLIELQSCIRGDWARQISDYRLGMKRFATNLQSVARGFALRMTRQTEQEDVRYSESQIIALQSIARARRSRDVCSNLISMTKEATPGLPTFQALIRGVLERDRLREQFRQTEHAAIGLEKLQAISRAFLERRRRQQQYAYWHRATHCIVALQSAVRARSTRLRYMHQKQSLEDSVTLTSDVQAFGRGAIVRSHMKRTIAQLLGHTGLMTALQAHYRGKSSRHAYRQVKQNLEAIEPQIIPLQAVFRGYHCRRHLTMMHHALHHEGSSIRALQGRGRGTLYRGRQSCLLQDLCSTQSKIRELQALSRALLLRSEVGYTLSQLDDEEPAIESLQAATRAMLVRQDFAEKRFYFNQNMEKVIKVQSFVRAKQQGQAYKSLTSGKNPPVGTVKNFVHLLNDSDFDFDEEVEFERLRKTVVQHVRQNEMADQYITQLDIKIALLVKNKITLDEVVKHQKHFGGSVGSLLTNSEMSSKDPFDLKALNKNSRKKLEHYQELFFVLQTQPQYLARLFRKIREQATPEKESERTKHLVMGLFGYAQKRREEYYLIKLITRSIKEDIDCCRSLQEYLRGNFFWAKVFVAYTKSPKDRKFLRDLLGPIVTDNIIDNTECDLESDPMAIYLKAIENEQLRNGQRSHRRPDIPREAAIRDPETKSLFIAHLQDLRDVVDQTFTAIEEVLHKMPYGVRYIARQMFHHIQSRFPDEDSTHLLQVAGHWLWKNYLQPALMEPDKLGVVDRGLNGDQKRNLAEVAKVFGQVASGRLFGKENIFLNPLNSYIGESIGRLTRIWSSMIDVPDAETNFDIDEFNDLYAKTKPTLYIKLADIFAIHHIVVADAQHICPSAEDMLRDVIRELGSAKHNEHELMSVSSSSEICLTLNPKLHDIEDPEAEVKTLFMETKRCVLYIIRVQSGGNLMEIMVKPITDEDEARWSTLVRDELSASSRKKGAYSDAKTLIDIASLSYSDLKRTALENILRLEQHGRLSRHNYYQDILNAIATDIRTKHRRRIQRARELEGVRLTLDRLNDQASYLDQQLKTYNDYIEQAMVTLQNKKGKKRFLMPFTKQWDHERELQRSGRIPKFGSFKYSAQELANRGILVGWQGYAERQWNQLDLTISSNEVGVFSMEGSSGSIAVPGATAQVPLDDLLQAQYNGTQLLEFFGSEKLRVNVNLFLHLIMRKFYKDRDG